MKRALLSTLAGLLVVAFVSITPQLVERYFAPPQATLPNPYAIESSYIDAPGNRTRCPGRSKSGGEYNGWIMHQSDSSKALWSGRCVYLSPEAMRSMM